MAKENRIQRPNRHRLLVVILAVTITGLTLLLVSVRPAQSHGFPIIDGAFTGDWCAPAFKGAFGPDSYTPLTMPACPLGNEFYWDDWDAAFYGGGIGDTMGWMMGGLPGFPVPVDFEVDISFFATTADATDVYFAVELGVFPSTTGVPPHVQIAIDVDGPASGNPFWYDPVPAPLPFATLPVGLAALPAGIFPDYLITTDVAAGVAFVWEATSVPGIWSPIGPVPLGWSGPSGTPGIIEIAVPWPMFAVGLPFGPGIPVHMTIMSAHSMPFIGPSDAPLTPQDDIFTEFGAGFTTSPDVCPPGPPSTDCELFIGPGGGGGSQDAFISVLYPASLPDFSLNSVPTSQQVCQPNDAGYQVGVQSISGFAGPVSLTLGGEPAGALASFSPNGSIAPYTSTLTITNMISTSVGSYSMEISGTWMSVAHTTTVGLDVIDAPGAISLVNPLSGTLGVSTSPTFAWQGESTAVTYTLEIATDSLFSNTVVIVSGISGTSYPLSTSLNPNTTYYWRVRGHNGCGIGTSSSTWNFTTAIPVYLPVMLK